MLQLLSFVASSFICINSNTSLNQDNNSTYYSLSDQSLAWDDDDLAVYMSDSYESCVDTSLFSHDSYDEEVMRIFASDDNITFCPNLASSPIPSDRSLSTSLSQRTVISQSAYDCYPFLQHNISAGCDVTSQVSNNSIGHF